MTEDDKSGARESAETLGDTLPSGLGETPDYDAFTTLDPSNYADRIEITRGGMGRVIAARDRRLKRKVAIKELRDVNPSAKARFEREVLLTARLQHPSIVNIYEAGVWPSGDPFYAMNLVAGRSLHQAIAATRSLDERMALLPHAIAVADALAYAHGQGVIHRDLKPHNVMIGSFGETVVIDWGLAKDLGSNEPADSFEKRPSQDNMATEVGVVMGTPAYMPPEQAEGRPADTRADVYAIGAILYHVLSGCPPYDGSTTEIIAAATTREPLPLPTRQAGIPEDLLAIVARAMSRDPAARYATAKELADDLRRFQAGQLVGAHRYSTAELVRRWLRRHRTAVTVAAIAMLALAVFGTVAIRRILVEQRVATAERQAAERHRADAEELMGFMLGDLREKLQPLGKLELLHAVAEKARDYYHGRPESLNPRENQRRAKALLDLGHVMRDRNDTTGALAEYRRTLAIADALPPSPAARDLQWRSHQAIADVLLEQDDRPGSLAEREQVVSILESIGPSARGDLAISLARVGMVHLEQGDSERAMTEQRKALELATLAVRENPSSRKELRTLAATNAQLGASFARLKKPAEALAAHRQALEVRAKLFAEDPGDILTMREVSYSHTRVGELLFEGGDTSGALAEYGTARELREALAARDPSNATWQRDLAVSYDTIGDVLHARGDTAALESFRRALDIRKRLVAKDPQNSTLQQHLAVSHYHIGELLLAKGDGAGAVAAFRDALVLLEQIAARDPTNAMGPQDVADTKSKLSQALASTGDTAGAIAELEGAVRILEELSAKKPDDVQLKTELTAARTLMAKFRAKPTGR